MRQSDILDRLKRKHSNLSEETIKLVLLSFHDALRYYLSHPEECKSGILINGLMSMSIPIKRLEKFIRKLKYEGLEIRGDFTAKERQTKEEVIEYYENLLQTVKKHERQTGKKRQDD